MNEVNSKNFRELIRILERKLGLLNKQDVNCSEVTLAQCHALVEMGRSKTISLKELSNILDLDISTMSRTIDSLVKKEFVVRSPSESDRRSIIIELSDKGLDLFNSIEKKMDMEFKNIFERISKEDQLIALSGLNIIIEAISQNHNQFTCTTRDLSTKCNNLNR